MASFLPHIRRRPIMGGERIAGQVRSSNFVPWTNYEFNSINGVEQVVDQCHNGYWRGARSVGDVGGDFDLQRDVVYKSASPTISNQLLIGPYVYGNQTGFQPTWNAAAHNDVTLKTFGTKAVHITAPTDPASSVSQALWELKRDGIPRLPGSSLKDRVDLARKSGDEFLNVEFGWAPLVRDVLDFVDTTRRTRQIIDQYRRDSGKEVRRRYAELPIVESKTTAGTGFVAPLQVNVNATGSVTEVLTTSYWFSGCFKYYVPVPDGVYDTLRYYESLGAKLYGLRITPELLWELAPWSWAVDWFTNVGDVFSNISRLGSDGLVMRYGYAMRNQRLQADYVQTVTRAGWPKYTVYQTLLSDRKRRLRANPYGFGIDFPGLSAVQLAILSALGLSKGRRDGNTLPEHV